MANILLLTRGSGGDVWPMIRIGEGLKARSHKVTLITHCIYEEQAKQAGLNFAALDSLEEAKRYLQDKDELIRPIEFVEYFRQHLLSKVPLEYEVIKKHYRSEETIIISSESARTIAQMSAEKLNIPFVLLYVAPKDIPFRFGRFIVTKSNIDRADALFFETRAAIGLPPLDDREVWEKKVAYRMGQWPEWFVQLKPDLPLKVKPIGFMFDRSSEPLSQEVRLFLDEGLPPILITHGTSIPQSPQFFKASVEACQELGYRGMLVTQHEDLVPQPLPDQVKWFKYEPYGSLTPHVQAIIHHGGLGTIGAAMLAGIPQLILAFGFDRPDNAINLQRLGIGEFLRIPQWQTNNVAKALSRLLNSLAIRARCQEIAGWVKEVDPVTTACDIIEGVLLAGTENGAAASEQQNYDLVVLESKLDEQLCRHLDGLSPEKHALLASRLGRQDRHNH